MVGCDACLTRWSATKPLVGCVTCSSQHATPIGWQAVHVQELVQEKGRWKAVLRTVHASNPIHVETASQGAPALSALIPRGKETKQLLDNKILRWGDLYTQRQADVLIGALSTIKGLDVTTAVKDRLAFSVLGAAEMPAFLSRWDRFHLLRE